MAGSGLRSSVVKNFGSLFQLFGKSLIKSFMLAIRFRVQSHLKTKLVPKIKKNHIPCQVFSRVSQCFYSCRWVMKAFFFRKNGTMNEIR